MMKLRKNLLIGLLAGLMAFAGVACDSGSDTEDPAAPADPAEDPLEEDPLEEEPLDEEPLDS